MKTTKVSINDKDFIVREYRNKELSTLMDRYKKELSELKIAGGPVDMYNVLIGFVQDKLTDLIPGLTAEDIENAYPSEIDAVVGAFLMLNFPLGRRFGEPMMMFMQLASKQQ